MVNLLHQQHGPFPENPKTPSKEPSNPVETPHIEPSKPETEAQDIIFSDVPENALGLGDDSGYDEKRNYYWLSR
ncbi:hypothetical protein LSPH24S_03436 [Lysinibacillus sphaericus]